MATIQWRPEVNVLTVPQSWKIRFVPRDVSRTDDLAAAMVAENPNYTLEDTKTMIATLARVIQKKLINGGQATIDGVVTFGLSFTGRLSSPDDPLPPVDETLHVDVRVLQPFLKEIKQQGIFEKRPVIEKAPVIEEVENTQLHLKDVLSDKSVLHLTGSNLFFNPATEGNECVIEGVRSGRQVQSQFGPISNASIILVPDIPMQNESWQNEYLLSLSTRYSEHGTPRTGMYRQRLRSVLLINGLSHPSGIGILSSSEADLPYVSLLSATASASEMLRIQAVFDIKNNWLLLNLISMQEDGPMGEAVPITANISGALPGFAGSAVNDILINVTDYAALTTLVRDYYYGRLVDVLDIRVT
jgi:hypothetical protein